MRASHILAAVLVVIAVGLGSGVATAQDSNQAQEEINNSLSEIETFIATTLGQLGIIVLLIGAAVWFFSGRRSDRAAWGWRAIWGGAGMIILSVSYNVLVSLIEGFAPGVVAVPFI